MKCAFPSITESTHSYTEHKETVIDIFRTMLVLTESNSYNHGILTTLLISPVYPMPCLGLEIIGSEIWSLYPVEIPLYKALLKKFEVQMKLDGTWPRGPK